MADPGAAPRPPADLLCPKCGESRADLIEAIGHFWSCKVCAAAWPRQAVH